VKIRVYYEDTDCGGIVYHTNYIKFCERARSEIFFQNKIIMDEIHGYFIVTNLQCEFKQSAKLGDLLDIQTKLIKIKRVSIILEQCIYNNNHLIYKQIVSLAYMKQNKLSKLDQNILDIIYKKL
jgi:acyl-CoA thioester hydrolase